MQTVAHDNITELTHEEALRFCMNYLNAMRETQPHSTRTIALGRLMSDIRKMHQFLQLLAEADNMEGNRALSQHNDYSKFRDPRIAKQVRDFIQEL